MAPQAMTGASTAQHDNQKPAQPALASPGQVRIRARPLRILNRKTRHCKAIPGFSLCGLVRGYEAKPEVSLRMFELECPVIHSSSLRPHVAPWTLPMYMTWPDSLSCDPTRLLSADAVLRPRHCC